MNNLIRAPPQPAPLSKFNTYTTWPGGVDPSAALFNTDNQKIGGKRRKSRNNRKMKRATRKNQRR